MVDIYEEDGVQYDMDSMGDFFRLWDKRKKEKKRSNRKHSTAMLEALGVTFETHNGGIHLIVRHEGRVVDFWPSTGKFIFRGKGGKGRGVRNLLGRLGIKPRQGTAHDAQENFKKDS